VITRPVTTRPVTTRPVSAGPALGRLPAPLVLVSAVAVAFLVVPLVGLVVRTPWRRLPRLLADPELADALWLSVATATVATILCLVLGLPLAWLLARGGLRWAGLVRGVVSVPLVLPPVVAGVALLAAFGRNGVVGGPLHGLTGVTVPFSTAAVVLAHTFVALPFFVISVEGALRGLDREYDAVAATLGADRWTTFRRVTVPMVLPGVAAGMLLAWARSLGEFGATITFAGNYPGVTQTMPLLVYGRLQSDPEAAYALSLVLLVVSVAVLAALRDRWIGAERWIGGTGGTERGPG
jgi:molybdate transport system permease protein